MLFLYRALRRIAEKKKKTLNDVTVSRAQKKKSARNTNLDGSQIIGVLSVIPFMVRTLRYPALSCFKTTVKGAQRRFLELPTTTRICGPSQLSILSRHTSALLVVPSVLFFSFFLRPGLSCMYIRLRNCTSAPFSHDACR